MSDTEEVNAGDEEVQTEPRQRLTKAERKLARKQERSKQMFLRHATDRGVELSTSPTSSLLVVNGGLDNSVDRETLLSMFSPFGSVQRIVMEKHKSYSFLVYDCCESAEKAVKELNGKPLGSSPLYISFLKDLPCALEDSRTCESLPPGLILRLDFIDSAEEERLLRVFESAECESAAASQDKAAGVPGQMLRHRRVLHYGYEFRYGSNDVDVASPLRDGLPSVVEAAVERMLQDKLLTQPPDQLTVNDYQPGQGIPPHVDTSWAFENGIASLSLGSSVVMDFRHPDGRHVPVYLPARSVLIMTGESRYVWSHGITPRKSDIVHSSVLLHSIASSSCSASSGLTLVPRGRRVSLTFRKVIACPQRPLMTLQTAPCTSAESSNAVGSGGSSLVMPVDEAAAELLERQHVHEVYDNIASHFSSTRHTAWPKVSEFLHRLPQGSLVLDVGCGNGKYINVNPSITVLGCDRSHGLAAICRERGFPVAVCDILNLPYRHQAFDACICIAVIHHLSTRERRLFALNQLLDVIRPDGLLLVYVWAQEQEKSANKGRKKKADDASSGRAQRMSFERQDVLVPWKFAEPGKKSGDQQKQSSQQCTVVPKQCTDHNSQSVDEEKEHEGVFHRYYHVFHKTELQELCKLVSHRATIDDYYHDRGNWCVILRKCPST